jgi:hypothetical protein
MIRHRESDELQSPLELIVASLRSLGYCVADIDLDLTAWFNVARLRTAVAKRTSRHTLF